MEKLDQYETKNQLLQVPILLEKQEVILRSGDPENFINMDGLLISKNKKSTIDELNPVQISYELNEFTGEKKYDVSNLPTRMEKIITPANTKKIPEGVVINK